MPGYDVRTLGTLRLDLKFLELKPHCTPTQGYPPFLVLDLPICQQDGTIRTGAQEELEEASAREGGAYANSG